MEHDVTCFEVIVSDQFEYVKLVVMTVLVCLFVGVALSTVWCFV